MATVNRGSGGFVFMNKHISSQEPFNINQVGWSAHFLGDTRGRRSVNRLCEARRGEARGGEGRVGGPGFGEPRSMQMQLLHRSKQRGRSQDKQKVILLTFEDALSWCFAAASEPPWMRTRWVGWGGVGWTYGEVVSYGNTSLSSSATFLPPQAQQTVAPHNSAARNV